MNKFVILSTLLLINLHLKSQDTFSITAIDTLTGEVGSAGASCIDESAIPSGCYILSDVKPGLGVIHTQAYWNPNNQNYASELMDLGVSPEDMIDSLVANDVQNNPHIRQYGIVDIHDGIVRCAAYTGMNCDDYKNHIIGPNYTIQGNILLGQQILDSMETRFLETEGELACKLMAALQGAKVIGADTRCLDDGTSSLSAFLRVAQPTDPPNELYLDFNVPSTPVGMDPIDSLQTLMDWWGTCSISSIPQNNQELKFHVFPNPASNFIVFKIMKTPVKRGKLQIHDGQGKLVFLRTDLMGSAFKFSLTLSPGIYFYKLIDQEENYNSGSGKFIIE